MKKKKPEEIIADNIKNNIIEEPAKTEVVESVPAEVVDAVQTEVVEPVDVQQPVQVEPAQQPTQVLQPNQIQVYQADLGLGVPVNLGGNQFSPTAAKLNSNTKGAGVAAIILAIIAIPIAFIAFHMQSIFFVDQVSTIIMSILGFGILVYAAYFLAFVMSFIALILAIVQISHNRKWFSILVICTVPLVSIASIAVYIFLIFF